MGRRVEQERPGTGAGAWMSRVIAGCWEGGEGRHAFAGWLLRVAFLLVHARSLLCCCRVWAETCVRVSASVWDVPWRYSRACAGHDDLQVWKSMRRRIQRRQIARTGPLADANPILPNTALRWFLRLAVLLVLVRPALGTTLYLNTFKCLY